MANAIQKFEMPANLPADIAAGFEEDSNTVQVTRVPSLGIKGKVFTISANGQTKQLMGRDANGEEVPLSVLRAVILGYNPDRGRALYEGSYVDGRPTMPVCWSDDSKRPSEYVADKKNPTCAGCQFSVKGSRQTDDGRDVSACSQFRLLAVLPYQVREGKLTWTQPLRLKIAVTSDWDGQASDKDQWMPFNLYTKHLNEYGVPHTALVVTKLRFDPNKAFPKLQFSRGDQISDTDQLRLILGLKRSDEVRDLISKSWTPNGVDGHRTEDRATTARETPKANGGGQKAAPATQPEDDEVPFDQPTQPVASQPAPTPKAAPVNPVPPTVAAAPAAAPVKAGKGKAKKPEPVADAPVVSDNSDVAQMMEDWN